MLASFFPFRTLIDSQQLSEIPASSMWRNLSCKWEADDDIEKGAHGLLVGDKNQQTNNG